MQVSSSRHTKPVLSLGWSSSVVSGYCGVLKIHQQVRIPSPDFRIRGGAVDTATLYSPSPTPCEYYYKITEIGWLRSVWKQIKYITNYYHF